MANRSWLLLATLYACVCFGSVVSGHAATINAKTCSLVDVTAAVSTATYGDTVTVPAGTCTWASALIVTKNLTLTGAGASSLTITASVSPILYYQPDVTSIANNGRFDLSGFTFSGGGVWIDPYSGTTLVSNIVVHDNTFQNVTTGLAALIIGSQGEVAGVAHHNTFANASIAVRFFEYPISTWNNQIWKYGDANKFYLEDNTLFGNSAFFYGDQSARYVVRFNNANYTAGSFQFFADMHGYLSSGNCGVMGAEIYDNTIVLSGGLSVITHRGGALMSFANNVSGSGVSSSNWLVRYEYAVPASTDIAHCGNSNPQPFYPSNSYDFLENFGGANPTWVPFNCTGCTPAIAENVNYWLYKGAAFDGTVGVGSGTKASMPSSCTTGVGFWVTNEGSWNTTLPPNTSGRFYKCTATNTWSLYYTPYTYPHPLRAGLAPAPPTGLQVLVQ